MKDKKAFLRNAASYCLPLTREVAKPQVLTEGEKTAGLHDIQVFLSLSQLR